MIKPYDFSIDGNTILNCISPETYLPNIKNCSRTWALKCHSWCIGVSHIKHHWVANNCGVLGFDHFCVKNDFVPWLRAVHKELKVHPHFPPGLSHSQWGHSLLWLLHMHSSHLVLAKHHNILMKLNANICNLHEKLIFWYRNCSNKPQSMRDKTYE